VTKPVPRSRLNISYRTKIDGKPKKAKLPMRLLALGDFTGDRRTLLNELRVHGLFDPSLREMQDFAWRCRAFLKPHVDRSLGT